MEFILQDIAEGFAAVRSDLIGAIQSAPEVSDEEAEEVHKSGRIPILLRPTIEKSADDARKYTLSNSEGRRNMAIRETKGIIGAQRCLSRLNR